MPTFARAAGTKLPAWASTAISAAWRRKVDLPPMLGPVISHRRSFAPIDKSLATKRSPACWSAASTTGWRPASISKHGSSVSCGRRPAAFGGAVGVARGDVDAGDGLGGRGDVRRGGDGEAGQLLGVRRLGRERVRARLDHAARFLVKIGRVEADDAGERLAMGEAAVRRHQPVGVLGRHLDMIAEHRIVPDFQRGDACGVAVSSFERGDRPAPVRRGIAQGIERGIIAFGDIAALGGIDRRGFDDRRAQAVDQRARGRRGAAAARPGASAARVPIPARSEAKPRPPARRATARGRAGFPFPPPASPARARSRAAPSAPSGPARGGSRPR